MQIEYQGMVMGLHNILTAAELPTRFQPAGSDSCTMSCPHSLCGILQNLKNSHKQTHLYQEHAHPLKGTLTQTPINSETQSRNITIHPTPSTAGGGVTGSNAKQEMPPTCTVTKILLRVSDLNYVGVPKNIFGI